jgi:hypothetical protein
MQVRVGVPDVETASFDKVAVNALFLALAVEARG